MKTRDEKLQQNIEADEQESALLPALSENTSITKGGRMTISPPAKVKNPPLDFTVLASGFDSLYLTMNVHWGAQVPFFLYLERLKAQAQESRQELPGKIIGGEGEIEWHFTIPPYGNNGYEWMLNGNDYTFKIGNWLVPRSMPSIQVEIRSETIWRLGAAEAVAMAIELMMSQGAKNVVVKPSRADLCLDLVLPEVMWQPELDTCLVTRAVNVHFHKQRRSLQGISIGQGDMSCRLYDKPREIRQQSKKFWMYDVWGIRKVENGKKIIRVEFQLRREVLVELGIIEINDLFKCFGNVWAYCTEKWMKFQDGPGKHHTQRKTQAWWKAVQKGFDGGQPGNPLIRFHAIKVRKEQYQDHILGSLSSLIAISGAEDEEGNSVQDTLVDILPELIKRQREKEIDGKCFDEIVRKKAARNARLEQRQGEVALERVKHDFPLGM